METRKPLISAILAMSENRVIGKNNQLPWHLPADLTHFKTLTTGHPIIMGRKTYASIGKPLPNRTNIILTRDTTFKADNCLIVHSPQQALEQATNRESKEIFIIGGAEIYQQLMPYTQRLYLTLVHDTVEGDTFFPPLNPTEWQELAREDYASDEKNRHDYSFITLARIKHT